ncbi:class I SAM-dependent methyltransferase [Natranaerofaba carboxydovora]|uniref:class I SAM-dependent methyltransferase n=1 Tax=Natranaerofaba carboxydovora TaxID=2742683 RepID=UPI001F128E47|nr:class I SAM-dependent methyltransferase [Natranaerofaba carboxydovora]UMZ74859.1 Methyltransferase domain protein [Natranaerofaba carboxydovora]
MASNNEKYIDNQLKWENSYNTVEDFFGKSPSEAAVKAAKVFKDNQVTSILELGGGQGRDTLYFAREGFQVYVLDYAAKGIKDIKQKAVDHNLSNRVTAIQHNVKEPLTFADDSFDGCFSHLLCCMNFKTEELDFLFKEIKRILKNGGINIYTVRNKKDPHFGTGTHLEGNIYNISDFIIHFFDRKTIERFSESFQILQVEELEEGDLPRRIYNVVLRNET